MEELEEEGEEKEEEEEEEEDNAEETEGSESESNDRNAEEVGSSESDSNDLFALVCSACGMVRALPFDADDSFVCSNAGLECSVEGGASSSSRSRTADAGAPALDGSELENSRTQLLWKVLIYNMSVSDTVAMFKEHGLEPPSAEELTDLRSNTLETFRKKTMGSRLFAKAAFKSKSKKGPVKRFLNNELVTVTKNDRYVREPKESAEDKAKTSVEIYVIGIGRGGRHAVKIAREEKHKGPRSHK